MTRSLRRAALDAVAIVLGLALAALVGEGALRAFWPQRSSVTLGMFEADPDAGYRLRSGYANEVRLPEYRTRVRTDDEGYRVPADPGAAAAAVEAARTADPESRLLAIGDSFTFGVGVNAEEAWPAVLETRLARESGDGWTVRNGGVGGYGPLRSARLFVASQAAWDPAIVVHAFYVGNDLEDPRPDDFLEVPRVRDGRMVGEGGPSPGAVRMWLRIHSHLYAFVRERLYGLYRASGLAERSQYLDPVGLATWPERITRRGWPAGRDAIDEMAAACEARGIRYLVVLVPTRWQVDDAAWDAYRRAWGLGEEAFDRMHAQREVEEFLAARGIPCLDPLPALRAATDEGRSTYFAGDPHWTREGHRVVAEEVGSFLRALGWVPVRLDRSFAREAPASRG